MKFEARASISSEFVLRAGKLAELADGVDHCSTRTLPMSVMPRQPSAFIHRATGNVPSVERTLPVPRKTRADLLNRSRKRVTSQVLLAKHAE